MDLGWWALHAVCIILGLVLLVITVVSVVRSMLVPRAKASRIDYGSKHSTHRMAWFMASRRREFRDQDAVLASVGPVSVLVDLCVTILLFLIAYALLIFGVSSLNAADSAYQSGSTLLTLGIVEAVNPAQVIVNLLSAFTGLVIIAVLIGFLLSLYSAYTSRETQVAKVSLSAGEPPWGPELLCRRHLSQVAKSLTPEEDGWVDWICGLRSAHTIYPVLNHFRSPSPNRNWLTTLLAMMDAAALQFAVCEQPGGEGCAELIAEGAQTFAVLRLNQDLRLRRVKWEPVEEIEVRMLPGLTSGEAAVSQAIESDGRRAVGSVPSQDTAEKYSGGVTRGEFDYACDVMAAAGIRLRSDRDAGWHSFHRIRQQYEANALVLASRLHVVPAPWSGGRRLPLETIWPYLATDLLTPDS